MAMRVADGFSLVELLISVTLLCALMGALFVVIGPVHAVFSVQPEVQDAQQRLRFAVTRLQQSIESAGAGLEGGPAGGPLFHYFASILPYRIGERRSDAAAGVFYRPDVLSVVTVPAGAARGRIRALSMTGGLVALTMDSTCSMTSTAICGFSSGMSVVALHRNGRLWSGRVDHVQGALLLVESSSIETEAETTAEAMLAEADIAVYFLSTDRASGTSRLTQYDGRATESPVVDHVVTLSFEYFGDARPPQTIPREPVADRPPAIDTTYGPRPPASAMDDPGDAWPVGENCVFTSTGTGHAPRLVALAGTASLVPLTASSLTDGPWCPDASALNRFDADLLRIRRIVISVRVQAPFPWLRGPRGAQFLNGGSGRDATRLIPDQEIQFAVTPRNLQPSENPPP